MNRGILMIKDIDVGRIKEVVDFSWKACQSLSTTPYPIRKSKPELEQSFAKSLVHPYDRVLGYVKDHSLFGVIELFVEVEERYLQAKTYILNNFAEQMDEVIAYLRAQYPGFTVHFGYPREHVMAAQYFIAHHYECIEASSDLRLATCQVVDKQKIGSHIERLTKENFASYASFHDQHGGQQMYWNSERLYANFESWYIYVWYSGTEIKGSILICKAGQDAIEVFGLFVEEEPEKYEITEELLDHSILQILAQEEGIQEVIFFVDEKDRIQYEVTRKLGFEEKGSYRCYAIDLVD